MVRRYGGAEPLTYLMSSHMLTLRDRPLPEQQQQGRQTRQHISMVIGFIVAET